jgi:hypothetical protein
MAALVEQLTRQILDGGATREQLIAALEGIIAELRKSY